MELEEAKEFIKKSWLFDTANENIGLKEAIETLLQELDRLQKENEKLKEIDLTTVHIKGVCDEKERWRNKIRELIEMWEPKLEETDRKVEKTKTQEERVVLHCIGLRLDERIKTLQGLLKEE